MIVIRVFIVLVLINPFIPAIDMILCSTTVPTYNVLVSHRFLLDSRWINSIQVLSAPLLHVVHTHGLLWLDG